MLIDAAREDHPDGTWVVGDLAELDLAAHGIDDPFDVIVCAGNVMTFLGHGTHAPRSSRMRAHLAPQGRVAVGFGTARGYLPEAFFADVETAGLQADVTFSTWDLRPYADGLGLPGRDPQRRLSLSRSATRRLRRPATEGPSVRARLPAGPDVYRVGWRFRLVVVLAGPCGG